MFKRYIPDELRNAIENDPIWQSVSPLIDKFEKAYEQTLQQQDTTIQARPRTLD